MCVCLSVREHILFTGTRRLSFTKFFVHVAYGRGSVPIRQRCDMSCTSGFVDDVMMSYNRPHGGVTLQQQSRCNVAYVVTPLLRDIGCVLTKTTAGANTRRDHHARGGRRGQD